MYHTGMDTRPIRRPQMKKAPEQRYIIIQASYAQLLVRGAKSGSEFLQPLKYLINVCISGRYVNISAVGKFVGIYSHLGENALAAAFYGKGADTSCGHAAEAHKVVKILAAVAAVGAEVSDPAAEVVFIAEY